MTSYTNLDLTQLQNAGPITIDYPLMEQGDSTYCEVSVPYGIFTANYTPPTIGEEATGEVSSSIAGGPFYCSGDYTYSDTGAHITKFVRRYNNRPQSFVSGSSSLLLDYETYTYTYPGIYSELITWAGRSPMTMVVPSKIVKNYYVIGVDVASPLDIPIIQETKYYYVNGSRMDQVSPSEMYLNNGGAGLLPSSPSLDTYNTMIALSATGSSNWTIVPEASKISKFRGNIYVRETRYIPTY